MNAIPINYWAVLVAAALRMAVGFVWYSPPVLLKPWQVLTGITPETMRAGLTRAMVVDVIASLIMAFALANIIGASGITDWLNGALAGFWVWLGFIATVLVSLWGYENRSLKLIGINLGNNLIALLLMGALLASGR